MISYLKGKIEHKNNNFIILNVGNVGYKVYLNGKLQQKFILNAEIEVFTHQHIKEDALDLYGFENLDTLSFFELLLSISGIGPKSALNAIDTASIGEFRQCIANGDSSIFTQVSGIGKKTAEKIIIELRDKINTISFSSDESEIETGITNNDEIDALQALGYSMSQAREALQNVDKDIEDSGARIREALKQLG